MHSFGFWENFFCIKGISPVWHPETGSKPSASCTADRRISHSHTWGNRYSTSYMHSYYQGLNCCPSAELHNSPNYHYSKDHEVEDCCIGCDSQGSLWRSCTHLLHLDCPGLHSCGIFSLWMSIQSLNTLEHLPAGIFKRVHYKPWKQISFLVFHIVHNTPDVNTFKLLNFFSDNQNIATDSKSDPIGVPIISKIHSQKACASQHSKNKCLTDSFSEHNIHDSSSTFLLFAKLSFVNVLLLAKSQRKMWTLAGIQIFRIRGVKMCFTPLSLTTT